MSATILYAEDDRAIRTAVTLALELEGYTVITAIDGAKALEEAQRGEADVLVLDVMMPYVDGVSICRKIRTDGDRRPVLMLTARTETSDRVAGLDAGADAYLPKPFDTDELLAHIRALLRRASFADPSSELTVADVRVDQAARRAWRGTRELELTKTEFDLLVALLRNTGIVLSHTQLYEMVWNYDFGPESKTLAVYMSYLRRKLEIDDEAPLIHTVRGIGYTLRSAVS
jgi:two-component system, OmpR family, response regulator MprA